jgi:AmmeMemoRadiSam system protein A
MIPDQLTSEERSVLLHLARQSLEKAVKGEILPALDTNAIPSSLLAPGATFVTLTKRGELRGCIGALEAHQPLVEDVREHAVAAALQDYRFPPVQQEEISDIGIEISRLTTPQPLEYTGPDDLVSHLRPGVDGVVIRDGFRRATFLPQVWEKIPDPRVFLSYLCQKMGESPDLWMHKKLEVLTYQVEEFQE